MHPIEKWSLTDHKENSKVYFCIEETKVSVIKLFRLSYKTQLQESL